MPRKRSPYNGHYKRVRALFTGAPCEARIVCDGDPSTSADHDPPISRHRHVEGSGCCVLRPACWNCQVAQRKRLAGQTRHLRAHGVEPEMITAPEGSRRWR